MDTNVLVEILTKLATAWKLRAEEVSSKGGSRLVTNAMSAQLEDCAEQLEGVLKHFRKE